MQNKPTDFTRLYFGKASAEREVASDRGRFLRTYLDRWDLPQQISSHEKFLILGPKGSGKSAAAYYVEGDWARRLGESAVFANSVDFDELNRTQSPLYSLDKKLVAEEVSTLTDAAWKLFIGTRLLDSLIKDNDCNLSRDPQVLKFADDLRRSGLASDDYPLVLRRVRERKGSISLPKVASGEFISKEADTLSPGQVGDAILKMIREAETPNRHLLSIDGLDKAIGENEAYWRTMAALVRVGDSICRMLQVHGNHSVYLLVMCRSDVFRRINFSDAPKIASDSGIQMEWGAEALCEDLIYGCWLARLPTSVADSFVELSAMDDMLKSLRAQTNFMPRAYAKYTFWSPSDVERFLGPEAERSEEFIGEQNAIIDFERNRVKSDLKAMGARLGWAQGKVPSIYSMAKECNLEEIYEFFYHGTSKAAHSDLHHMTQMVGRNPTGALNISSQRMKGHYSLFSLTYGMWLTEELFTRVIGPAFEYECSLACFCCPTPAGPLWTSGPHGPWMGGKRDTHGERSRSIRNKLIISLTLSRGLGSFLSSFSTAVRYILSTRFIASAGS